jgi:hypothetical protein
MPQGRWSDPSSNGNVVALMLAARASFSSEGEGEKPGLLGVTAEANRENVTVTARQSMSGCSPTRLAASETLTPDRWRPRKGLAGNVSKTNQPLHVGGRICVTEVGSLLDCSVTRRPHTHTHIQSVQDGEIRRWEGALILCHCAGNACEVVFACPHPSSRLHKVSVKLKF